MILVSTGISASTSDGEKYRSATEPSLHEDRMDFLGAVHAARERQLDVRRAARSRDDVDCAPAPGRELAVVPGLQEHTDLAQRLHERAPIEHGHVIRRQEWRRALPT